MARRSALNHGYYARGFTTYKGQLVWIDSSQLFPSHLGLLEIADRAKAWAMSTPEVEAYQLYRHFTGERTGRVVGCKIMLEKGEQCHA